jgi:hypothetical protein
VIKSSPHVSVSSIRRFLQNGLINLNWVQHFGCTGASHPALLRPGNADPWLRIDYGRETAIAKVVVTNRIDCCRPVLTTSPNRIMISGLFPFCSVKYDIQMVLILGPDTAGPFALLSIGS